MTLFLIVALLGCAAIIGMALNKRETARFFDGGAIIVVIVFSVLIGALVADNKVNNSRGAKAVSQTIDKPMCRITQAC